MLRLLPLLSLAFKIWMAIDAGRKQQPYYWFLIIFFVPFGDVVYFFVVKTHDFKWRKVKVALRSPPTLDQLKQRYRETPSIERLKARLLVRDNGVDPPGAEITRTSAGIEPIYQDIKALTIPVATF